MRLYIDVSGSVSEEQMSVFLREIKQIQENQTFFQKLRSAWNRLKEKIHNM